MVDSKRARQPPRPWHAKRMRFIDGSRPLTATFAPFPPTCHCSRRPLPSRSSRRSGASRSSRRQRPCSRCRSWTTCATRPAAACPVLVVLLERLAAIVPAAPVASGPLPALTRAGAPWAGQEGRLRQGLPRLHSVPRPARQMGGSSVCVARAAFVRGFCWVQRRVKRGAQLPLASKRRGGHGHPGRRFRPERLGRQTSN